MKKLLQGRRLGKWLSASAAAGAAVAAAILAETNAAPAIAEPTILFVTQPPFANEFAAINTVFGNHQAYTPAVPRGGDLYIRYGDGTLRNLTAEAGYGLAAGQDISVREPSVHWGGKKALFSMVVGGTTKNVITPVYWQIYEVTGLERGGTTAITRMPQPSNSNNVSPLYGTDGRILFTSDLPRNGNPATAPQLDEYESAETNTGIWTMKPDGSDVHILDHVPSGAFTPIIASDGRVMFNRWDHLVRDQQNNDGTEGYGAFNYQSETSPAQLTTNVETFPEPLVQTPDGFLGHKFNHFLPWQINEDGSGLETLNHVGRHELLQYFPPAHTGLPYFYDPNQNAINGLFLHIKESPTEPGTFFGTSCPEFHTHSSGQIVSLNGAESVNAADMKVTYVTDPMTTLPVANGQTPPAGHPGHFRNPTPLSDGTLIAVRTSSPFAVQATGGPFGVQYDFHLTRMAKSGAYYVPTTKLIPSGIQKSVSYWDNYSFSQLSYSGTLWELDPVEVIARPIPAKHSTPLPDIEKNIIESELGAGGVQALQSYLKSHDLALVVSRNVTRRADMQQDFNLKIKGSSTQTAMPGATPVEIAFLQFFQGDLIRGYSAFTKGRRAIAVPMHDAKLPKVTGAPAGAVALGADGSMAAFVPARRALTWQLTAADGTPVVRERYWVTFAPGEMRVCANCHGINKGDVVLNQPSPTNPPQALHDLLLWYASTNSAGAHGDGVGTFTAPNANVALRETVKADSSVNQYQATGVGQGWIPIAGDWDGDGVDTIGFYDPATSTFHLRNSNDAGPDDATFIFGTPSGTLKPIAGDWDGDGTDTIGLFDSATRQFSLRNSNSAGAADVTFVFGLAGAKPVAGDWDGLGGDSVGVYLPSTGQWFLRNTNSAGAADITLKFKASSPDAVPIVGDWDNNKSDTPGFYYPKSGQFNLINSTTKLNPRVLVKSGVKNAVPLHGDWNGG